MKEIIILIDEMDDKIDGALEPIGLLCNKCYLALMYLKKLPRWVSLFYPNRLFRYSTAEKVLYLTFDDGPNLATTDYILDTLAQYNAKATFFCIGKNAVAQPDLLVKITGAGHLIGNHTFHHLNGWQENVFTYLTDISQADKVLKNNFFRPPYGRMRRRQEHVLKQKRPSMKVVMWSVLSGDFDTTISGEQCWQNVRSSTGPGDVIVFHDSDKARERMEYALPKTLEYFASQGYRFEVLQ